MNGVDVLILSGGAVEAGGDGEMPERRIEESREDGGGGAVAAEGDCEAACGGSDVDEGGTGVILSTGEGGRTGGWAAVLSFVAEQWSKCM